MDIKKVGAREERGRGRESLGDRNIEGKGGREIGVIDRSANRQMNKGGAGSRSTI